MLLPWLFLPILELCRRAKRCDISGCASKGAGTANKPVDGNSNEGLTIETLTKLFDMSSYFPEAECVRFGSPPDREDRAAETHS